MQHAIRSSTPLPPICKSSQENSHLSPAGCHGSESFRCCQLPRQQKILLAIVNLSTPILVDIAQTPVVVNGT
ncbi:MAG TPA: hypothetical protein VFR01_08000 [Geobacterales bacterium]|nr:hypothetical protein [Geobacterales bacterium]